jgi:Flp pilus assembly protein TadG
MMDSIAQRFKLIWKSRKAPQAGESGQQMIEFTFTFVMLIVLFMAILILGWLFYSYATITNAARDGSWHLMTHPVLPADQDTFATADAEATWIVTRSMPLLDWGETVVNITPPVEERVYGAYVMVEVQHTLQMPRIEIPLGFDDTVFELGGPFEISAISRRSLD